MSSEEVEALQQRLAAAKVQLAIRKESNLLQTHNIKALLQENAQLTRLISEMTHENHSLSAGLMQIQPENSDFLRNEQEDNRKTREEKDFSQKWTALVRNWRAETAKKMCKLGVPVAFRAQIWRLAVGNALKLTHQLYYIHLNRGKSGRKCPESVGRRVKSLGEMGVVVSEQMVWEVYSVLLVPDM